MKAIHTPTGKRCTVMSINRDRAFCNFGDATNPFTAVVRSELQILCERPEGWEVDPEEVLGIDDMGRTYYRLKRDVFRTKDGQTMWVCTLAGWELFCRVNPITLIKEAA